MSSKLDKLNKLDILGELLASMFKHQLQVKLFHFQTPDYSAHKASDGYLIKFEELLDKFFEVAQGIYGRVNINGIEIKFKAYTKDTINQELDKFAKILNNISEDFDNTDLTNLRDEMLGELHQFKYLLTFH